MKTRFEKDNPHLSQLWIRFKEPETLSPSLIPWATESEKIEYEHYTERLKYLKSEIKRILILVERAWRMRWNIRIKLIRRRRDGIRL